MLTRNLFIGRTGATDIPRTVAERSRRRVRSRLTPLALAAIADREGVDSDFDHLERADLLRGLAPDSKGPAPGAE